MTNEFTNWHNYYYQVSMLFAEIEEHFYQLIATPVIIVLACKDHLFLHQGTDLKTFCALTVRMAFGYFYHPRFAECFFLRLSAGTFPILLSSRSLVISSMISESRFSKS